MLSTRGRCTICPKLHGKAMFVIRLPLGCILEESFGRGRPTEWVIASRGARTMRPLTNRGAAPCPSPCARCIACKFPGKVRRAEIKTFGNSACLRQIKGLYIP